MERAPTALGAALGDRCARRSARGSQTRPRSDRQCWVNQRRRDRLCRSQRPRKHAAWTESRQLRALRGHLAVTGNGQTRRVHLRSTALASCGIPRGADFPLASERRPIGRDAPDPIVVAGGLIGDRDDE